MPVLLVSVFAVPATASRHPRQLNESFRETQINPSIVVIIIILTIIFFLSGCLHLLIRCLVMRHPRRDPNSIVTLTALQGQLQQLFHLHDSGVEQAFIDTLPVFFYKSVTGLKEGADCAVCLCEFEGEDRLRLLPKCSHAFHMDCIDTWLLSHSTCPLCRRSLLPDDVGINAASHQGLLLESSRSSIDTDAVQRAGSESGLENTSVADNVERGAGTGVCSPTSSVIKPYSEFASTEAAAGASVSFPEGHPQSQYAGKVLTVQLGRFRVVEGGSHTGMSSSITGSRRSYSVGSYEYVLDPSNLEVVIAPTPLRKRTSTPRRPTPGHRATLSECTGQHPHAEDDEDDDDVLNRHRLARTIPTPTVSFDGATDNRRSSAWVSIDLATPPPAAAPAAPPHQRITYGADSTTTQQSSRRASSFRQPVNQETVKLKVSASRRSLSEAEILGGNGSWSTSTAAASELQQDSNCSFSGAQLVSASTELSYAVPPHAASHVSLRGAASAPYALAKRTLNWIVGRQQRWTTNAHGGPAQL